MVRTVCRYVILHYIASHCISPHHTVRCTTYCTTCRGLFFFRLVRWKRRMEGEFSVASASASAFVSYCSCASLLKWDGMEWGLGMVGKVVVGSANIYMCVCARYATYVRVPPSYLCSFLSSIHPPTQPPPRPPPNSARRNQEDCV